MSNMGPGDIGVTCNFPDSLKNGLLGTVRESGVYDVAPGGRQAGYQVDMLWTPYRPHRDCFHPVLNTVFIPRDRFKPLSDPDGEEESLPAEIDLTCET